MNMVGHRRQSSKVISVHRGDHRTATQIRVSNEERIDGEVRTGADATQELARAHADPGIDRMDLDALAPETREDPGVGRSTSHDLGEHRRDGRHR